MTNTHRDKSRISLELLEIFVTVAQQGSISAAARHWNISPSLATRKMALLEAELKTHLFDRTARRIYLTDAGRMTLAWATEVLEGHAHLFSELDDVHKRVSGTLRVVSNEYLLTVVLPEFLASFSRQHPDIRFVLKMTDGVVSSENPDYDVAIYSGQAPDITLKGIRIRDYQRVLCASPGYLARRGRPETIQSLAQHDCLVHQQAADGSWTFRKGSQVIRQRITPVALSSSYMPLIELAKSGLGIVQISTGSVRRELEMGELVTVLDEFECANNDGTRPATWVMFPGRRDLLKTQVFVAALTKYLRELSR
jgi:LysR family transcriptional activator of dmlA